MSDARRWSQYASKYDEVERPTELDAVEYDKMTREWVSEQIADEDYVVLKAFEDRQGPDPTPEQQLTWDTSTGVIRPRLILLNAWLKVGREMASEGKWGQDLQEELCDDDWATLILTEAGASFVEASTYVLEEWK